MAFTTTDLSNVETAIIKLAQGARVVQVNVDGDVVEYNKTTIAQLLNLRDQIKAELNAEDTTSTTYSQGRARRVSTGMGY